MPTHLSTFSSQFSPSPSARHYHPPLSIWLSVDPLADKYPGVSPYVYCANNPVRLVDPDGKQWWIDDKKYHPGQECPREYSESTRMKWEAMNRIYATPNGYAVIDEMESSSDLFNIVSSENDDCLSGRYRPFANTTGGQIELYSNDLNIETLSHEIFHGYQDMYGQGGSSIVNEMEANLFAYSVCKAAGTSPYYNIENTFIFARIGTGKKGERNWNDKCLRIYNNNANLLYDLPILDINAFNYVRDEFQSYSSKNWRGTYSNYPLQRANQENRLISKFYPL